MMRAFRVSLLALIAAAALSRAQAESETYLYSYGSEVQTPGHPLALVYETSAASDRPIRVRVYRLSERTFIDLVREGKSMSETMVEHLDYVAHGESATLQRDQGWNRTVVLAALPVGLYAVVARVDKGVLVTKLDVTTLGIAQARSYDGRGDVVLFPADLRTYDRYPGKVSLHIVNGNGSRDLPVQGGVARWAAKLEPSAAIVGRASDGSLAAVQAIGSQAESGSTETGFVQTDRPIYRPGDSIALRAILRDGWIGSYSVPQGTRHVRVQAPDGSNVFDHDEAVSTFGTLDATIRLAEDAQTGSYAVTVGSSVSKSIVVAAYKKPEYEMSFATSPAHVVGGSAAAFAVSARYFFGRPAAGMHLRYTVFAEPHFYDWWWGPYQAVVQDFGLSDRSGRKQLATGEVTTDANGRGAFTVSTGSKKQDEDFAISVEGHDSSGRTVSTSATLLVTAASFQVWVTPASWFGQAGTATTLRVSSRTYDQEAPKPGVPVLVEIAGRRWERDREVQTGTQSFDVTTGPKGEAALDWTPPSAGDYILKVTAPDENGRTASSSSYLWVLGSGENSWMAPIEQPLLIADKDSAPPGGRAKLVIALPKSHRDVIVMTSTDRLVSAQVVHVAGTSAEVTVDVPEDATSFNVIAMLPGENGVEQAYASIKVAPAARALRVSLIPGKHRYLPGEHATFAVRVLDAGGRPQRAQLGIGVVDESIYAVQAEDETDPLETFYSGRGYIDGSASWFRPNRGGMLKTIGNVSGDVYSVNAAAPIGGAERTVVAPVAVRSNFVDTAYWSPSVVTDADGRATIAFTWPDNLTTWRATGIGVTEDGDIGKGTGSALVTKEFLVRLETPRFLRAGDRSTIVGIAHGVKANPDVRLQLDAGALAKGPLDATLRLDAFESANASWPVVAPGVGSVQLTLSGGDGVRSDAMRLPLPLEAGTAAEHVRDAGSAATRGSFTVRIPPGYLAGAVHLSLSPSLIAELVQNQRLLDVYPYYCTEQTMSAGLPAVFIGRVLRQAHLKAPQDVSIDDIVRHAVARLAQLQHDDGSWGWWEYDDGHPFMTAYALYGLAEFRKDGYSVPNGMFDRGVDSLVSQLATTNGDTLAFWGGGQQNSQWNTRAFMLYSLAGAAPKRVDRGMLERTRSHAREMNPYALAVLGLAEHWLGNDDAAHGLLAQLDRRAVRDGAFTYWRGDTWHYAWEDDPIETTAYALRLEVAMGAGADRIDPIVNFLRAQRRGDWWYTTKDTAAAIYALTEAIRPDANEFSPDEIVRVLVDGKAVRTLHVTEPILDAADASVVVPASLVHEGSAIAFERTGRGALYWSSDAVRYVPTNAASASDAPKALLERLFAKAPPLEVSRRYTLAHGGPWRVGDEITVEVTVRARSDVQYLAIEDPFPAGAEHQPEQGHAGDDAWSGIQMLDDRAVFFADRLSPSDPLTIRYTLRATTPGHYTAPAPSVYAMYGPPVSALGHQQAVEIAP